jgi:hypothetical protein
MIIKENTTTTVSFNPTPDIYPILTQTGMGSGSEMGAKLQIVFN